MRSIVLPLALSLMALGARAADPSPSEAALAAAEAAAVRFAGALKARVLESMGSVGPAGTVDVCSREAPAIKAAIEKETGVTLGRGSLRLRNPANAGPPWVQAWLATQGERKAEGVTGLRAVVDGQARVIKPIAVEGACLACHGPVEAQPAELRQALLARYPQDRATGYAMGDLRGALWAEVAVGR